MTPEELLLQQNLTLREEIKELTAIQHNIWKLMVVVCRRMQISSASVKAAVTSLLNNDIFWDASTQYEFLQMIDDSTDNFSDLAMLVSLVSRLQVDKIHLKLETQVLQEILSKLEDDLPHHLKDVKLDIEFSPELATVLVDYEYLMIALRLLFMSMLGGQDHPINVRVVVKEMVENRLLEIRNINSSVHNVICNLPESLTEEYIKEKKISPDKVLMVYTAYKLLTLQNIRLRACLDNDKNAMLQLEIPFE